MSPEQWTEYVADMQRKQAESQERHEMSNESALHEIVDLFRRLAPADLEIVRSMVTTCGGDVETSRMLFGLSTGAMIYGHGRDWYGRSPEEALLGADAPDPTAQADEPMKSQSRGLSIPEHFEIRDGVMVPPQRVINEAHEEAIAYGKKRESIMRLYNIEQGMDPATKELYLRCTECRIGIKSVEDRVMKAPGIEGCPTCVQKAKWG